MSSRFSLSAVTLGAVLLSVSSLLSRGMGVLRDYVFSKTFGVGSEGGRFALDAYYVAFKVPDLLYVLLIFGAMSAAFIPMYSQLLKREGREEAFQFASAVLKVLFAFLFVLSALAFVFAPFFIPLLTRSYSPELQGLTVTLTRILLLSPLFLGLSGVLQGIENAHKSFWGAAAAPLVYNASIILSAYFLAPRYGVYALAWGAVLGTFLHFLVQVPGTLHTGFRFRWRAHTRELKTFFALMLPRLFGVSAAQLGVLVHTFLCTVLPLGSLSIYTYAFNLQSIVYGVVAVSISTAVFSTLAELVDTPEHFLKTLRISFSEIWFWVLPATVGLFFLREPVVELILQGGKFDAEASRLTVQTLSIFVWAALPLSFVPLLTRAFYSLRETWLPVKIALVSVVADLVLSSLLILYWKQPVSALAFGDIANASLNMFLLALFLARRTEASVHHLIDWKAWLKTAFSTLAMLGFMLLLPTWPLQLIGGAVSYFGFQLLLSSELRLRLYHKVFA